jgi:serine protease Do
MKGAWPGGGWGGDEHRPPPVRMEAHHRTVRVAMRTHGSGGSKRERRRSERLAGMRRFVSFGPALVVLLTVMMVLAAGPAAVHRMQAAQVSAQIVLAQASLDQDDILERLNAAVRNIASSVRPSVVHIDAGALSTSGGLRLSGSTGTGWVYSESGHIVTNLHVVRGSRNITVQFANGRVLQTEPIHDQPFVGDPFTDVAVLKVPAIDGLYAARRATGIQPQQGDRVYAFGSPFGFKFSMSEGIISGLGRDPMTAVEYRGFTNFIQTDAAVNPGNSGGPLVDIRGRVVGMNVAIATGRESQGTNEGQSAGISFAIPLGTIESVVKQLVERGTVARGYLGIEWAGREGELEFDESLGRRGVRVRSVVEGGPAARAGLQGGDLITEIHGQPVTSWEALRATVTAIFPGENINVQVWREGEARNVSVVLGEFPADDLSLEAGARAFRTYGLALSDGRGGRPLVLFVAPNSAAARDGFAEGQLMLNVGDRQVNTAREVYIAAVNAGMLQGWMVPVVVAEVEGAGEQPARRGRGTVPEQQLRQRQIELRLVR